MSSCSAYAELLEIQEEVDVTLREYVSLLNQNRNITEHETKGYVGGWLNKLLCSCMMYYATIKMVLSVYFYWHVVTLKKVYTFI